MFGLKDIRTSILINLIKISVNVGLRVITFYLKILSFLKTTLWNVSVLCPQFSLIQFGSGAA